MGTLWRCLFSLSSDETSYAKRGFRGANEAMRNRLEQVGAIFVSGYHAALDQPSTSQLTGELNRVEPELRGFAFEGAAMGLALLDGLVPWRSQRVGGLLRGPGDAHAYMIHVGVGWVWARLPFWMKKKSAGLDSLLSWLAYDGWGFHEGFFHWPEYVGGKSAPARLKGYETRVFDQGLGRSFWFVNGGDPELIAQTIAGLPSERHGDLWSGIGLAATYAGVVVAPVLESLKERAGEHRDALGQGAAFAAKARQRAGNVSEYTQLATDRLCGLTVAEAAQLCDETLENLPANGGQPGYEVWRTRIQHRLPGKRHLTDLCAR